MRFHIRVERTTEEEKIQTSEYCGGIDVCKHGGPDADTRRRVLEALEMCVSDMQAHQKNKPNQNKQNDDTNRIL